VETPLALSLQPRALTLTQPLCVGRDWGRMYRLALCWRRSRPNPRSFRPWESPGTPLVAFIARTVAGAAQRARTGKAGHGG
jgi:hypothetical protein